MVSVYNTNAALEAVSHSHTHSLMYSPRVTHRQHRRPRRHRRSRRSASTVAVHIASCALDHLSSSPSRAQDWRPESRAAKGTRDVAASRSALNEPPDPDRCRWSVWAPPMRAQSVGNENATASAANGVPTADPKKTAARDHKMGCLLTLSMPLTPSLRFEADLKSIGHRNVTPKILGSPSNCSASFNCAISSLIVSPGTRNGF